MNNNRGLHLKPIVTEGDKKHYILGGFTKVKGEVLNKNGNWRDWLPVGEGQKIDQRDTYACADFGTLNALETLLNFKYGITTNYSDRALAIDAGTILGIGTDPHDVGETIRKKGIVKEETLPTNEAKTVEEFYTPKPLTPKIRKEADEWTWNWEFGHEWVFTNGDVKTKHAKLKEALTRGTVCVSVYAWIYDYGNQWYYKPEGEDDNHWVQLVKFEGECPIIFDSNEGYTKKLAPDFDFSVAKVYYINKLDGQKKKSILSQILEIIKKILQIDAQIITKVEVKTLDEVIIPMKPTIEQLAKIIEKHENVDKSLNNPGGLRYSYLQAGQIKQKLTGKPLSYFVDYATGLKALLHQIRIVCNGKSPAYTVQSKILGLKDCGELSIAQFISIYAPRNDKNNTDLYVKIVCDGLGIKEDYKMKDFVYN